MKGSRQRILLGNAALFFLGIHGLTIKNRLCNHEKYENGEVFSLEVSIQKVMDIYWWIFHSYSSYVAGRQNGGVGWDGKCSKLLQNLEMFILMIHPLI